MVKIKGTLAESAVTAQKIDFTTLSLIRLKASANTALSTTPVVINMGTVDTVRGSGLTRSGNAVSIGTGISHVFVSVSLFAEAFTISTTYFFPNIRRGRSGTFTEYASSIMSVSAGFAGTTISTIIPVQSGDTIDTVAVVGSGTASCNSSRLQSLSVIAI